MGVLGFYSFMKETGAICKVKISDEVLQYTRKNKKPPVIVVDGISIIYQLYMNKNLPCLYGGQLKEYKEHLEFFIEKFKKEGVELVFYFDGVNVLFNTEGWIIKNKKRMQSVNKIYDDIDKGNLTIKNMKNMNNMIKPRNIWAVTIFVVKERGCKVKFSVDECDKEVAMYAKQNNCMAILAIDTDFIIYDTVKTYSSINMNLDKMTFNMYNKSKMCKKLQLKSSELPIFASLLGNDYILPNDLKHFHARLQKGYQKDRKAKYYNVAGYIRNLRLKISNSMVSYDNIKNIARYVFHDVKKSELLSKSLEFYSTDQCEHNACEEIIRKTTDTNWRSIIRLFYEELHDGDLFGIVAKLCYQESMSLDDYRLGRSLDIPPATNVVRPLREKLYGLLLHEYPGQNNRVEEWVFEGLDSLGKPHFVCPQKLNIPHPGLISIYKRNDADTEWSLIGDIFNITPVFAKNLPEHLVVPALTYRYIKDKVAVEESEMNALVLSAVLVSYLSVEELGNLNIEKIGSRPMRLFNLVTCAYEIILLILKILKNVIAAEMAVPFNYQDGKLFHLVYQMSHGKNMSKEDILKYFLLDKIKFLHDGKVKTEAIFAFIAR